MSEEVVEATEVTEATEVLSWHDGLANVSDKDQGYKNLQEFVDSKNSMSEMIGKKGLIPPDDSSSDEDRQAFTESIQQYIPSSVPVDNGYEVDALIKNEALSDDRRTDIYKDFAEAGLSNKQANAVIDVFGKQMQADMDTVATFNDTNRAETVKALKEEFGAEYEYRSKAIDGVVKNNAYAQSMAQKLEKVGMAGDSDFAHLMDMVARSSAEDNPGSATSAVSASSNYEEYLKSDEYTEMMKPLSKMSIKDQDIVKAKARDLLRKTL